MYGTRTSTLGPTKSLIGLFLTVACLCLFASTPAHARVPLLTQPGEFFFINSPFMLGFEFTVGPNDIQVTALGYQGRADGDGLASEHAVSLWSLDETQLASVLVRSGTNADLFRGYWYEDLDAPVVLAANQTYILVGAATPTDAGYSFSVLPDDLASPGITIERARWANGNSTELFPLETFTAPVGSYWTSANLTFITPGLDADNDGVLDEADNCTLVSNGSQLDTDNDGIGNACDADLNNDCVVNVLDLGIFRQRFFSSDVDADFNGDGTVNVIDLGILRTRFFAPPGPSCSPNVCD